MTQVLCRLEEIADGGTRGFALGSGAARQDIFVVRQQDRVFGYVNSCPHIGTPLEFLPDRFLTADGREILCSTHGARFEIATGRCVAGPCHGRALQRVGVRVAAGAVVVDGPPASETAAPHASDG